MISLQKCSNLTFKWKEWRIWLSDNRWDLRIIWKNDRDLIIKNSKKQLSHSNKERNTLRRRVMLIKSKSLKVILELIWQMIWTLITISKIKTRKRKMLWNWCDRRVKRNLINKRNPDNRARRRDLGNLEGLEIDTSNKTLN